MVACCSKYKYTISLLRVLLPLEQKLTSIVVYPELICQ